MYCIGSARCILSVECDCHDSKMHSTSAFWRLELTFVPALVKRPSPIQLSVSATSSPKWLLALVAHVEPAPVCRVPAQVRAQTRSAGGVVAVKTSVEEPLRKQNDIARPVGNRGMHGPKKSADGCINQCTHRGSDSTGSGALSADQSHHTHLNESVAVSRRLPRLAAKPGASSQSMCVARDGAALPAPHIANC